MITNDVESIDKYFGTLVKNSSLARTYYDMHFYGGMPLESMLKLLSVVLYSQNQELGKRVRALESVCPARFDTGNGIVRYDVPDELIPITKFNHE